MKTVLSMLLGVLSVLAAGGQQESLNAGQDTNQQEFVDKSVGYRATFPGTPKVKILSLRDEGGRVHQTYNASVELNQGKTKYAVQCELKPLPVKVEDLKEWATKSVAAMSKRKQYRKVREVQAGDYAGFETTEYRTPRTAPSEETNRHFLIGKGIYQVYVRAPAGEVDAAAAARFLDSFRPLSPAERKRDPSDKIFVRDTFAGPNGLFLVQHFMDIGTGWKEYGGGAWRIRNKKAGITVQSGQDVIATDAEAADAILTCDLTTSAQPGMDAGLVARLVDNDNYWMLAIRDNRVEVYKKSAGAYTSLGVPPFTFRPRTTYHLKLVVNGNRMTAFVDGEKVIEVTMDAFLTATQFGLRDNSSAKCQPSWDNFEVARP
jgi:hypothetical protein